MKLVHTIVNETMIWLFGRVEPPTWVTCEFWAVLGAYSATLLSCQFLLVLVCYGITMGESLMGLSVLLEIHNLVKRRGA